jgi:hypothetical protein
MCLGSGLPCIPTPTRCGGTKPFSPPLVVAGVCMCWELNFLTNKNYLKPSHTIPSCGACALFQGGDKGLYMHTSVCAILHNKEAPFRFRYRCLTPWAMIGSSPPVSKRKPEDPSAVLSPTWDACPNKKWKTSSKNNRKKSP